jgi:hypothetical protein
LFFLWIYTYIILYELCEILFYFYELYVSNIKKNEFFLLKMVIYMFIRLISI